MWIRNFWKIYAGGHFFISYPLKNNFSKIGEEPTEIIVYYHPETKKHLGMALIDFEKSASSVKFISKYHQNSVMGSVITCEFDTMGNFLYKIQKIP